MAEQQKQVNREEHHKGNESTSKVQEEELEKSIIEAGLDKLKNTLQSLENASFSNILRSPSTIQNSTMHDMITRKSDDHDKTFKAKSKKNRELGELEDNIILPSRLRSDSGTLYSSSVVIDAAKNSTLPSVLEATSEERENRQTQDNSTVKMKPCSEGACCKNTATIVTMIEKLQRSVDEIRKENQSQLSVNTQIGQDMRMIEEKVQENDKCIESLEKELDDYKFQMKLIANVVIRQDQQITNLTKRMNDAQQREMYPNIVISGIIEKPGENTLRIFNQFVQDKLEIQELIPAHRAFRIGMGRARPIIAELRDPYNQKGKIYQKVAKLKNKRNEEGGRFFVSDHLPEEYNESRRRVNELVAENKKKKNDDKLKMSVQKGKLLIEDQPYEKEIQAPGPQQIFKPDEKLWDTASEIDMIKGKDQELKDSTFIAYAAAIQDLEDVRAAYLKVKTKFANASHVACAFRLPGRKTPTLQDYQDDGECGAGRVMLSVLKEATLMNIVVFMIRQHGGINLGPTRFDLIRKVTESAVKNLQARLEEYKREEEEKRKKEEEERQQQVLKSGSWPDWPTEEEGIEQWEKTGKETANLKSD